MHCHRKNVDVTLSRREAEALAFLAANPGSSFAGMNYLVRNATRKLNTALARS